jgi:amino-acid N-acetyltransferase
MQDIAYMFATEDDAEEIKGLLRTSRLPTGGIAPHLQNFMMAKTNDGLKGVIGIEAYGKNGILRSFAVAEEARGQGIGKELFAMAIEHARELKIADLYLLTTTAEGFFSKRGFVKTDRKTTPYALQGTIEFKSACPKSAACMKMHFEESAQ